MTVKAKYFNCYQRNADLTTEFLDRSPIPSAMESDSLLQPFLPGRRARHGIAGLSQLNPLLSSDD